MFNAEWEDSIGDLSEVLRKIQLRQEGAQNVLPYSHGSPMGKTALPSKGYCEIPAPFHLFSCSTILFVHLFIYSYT